MAEPIGRSNRVWFVVLVAVGVVGFAVGLVLLISAMGDAGTCTQQLVAAGECVTVGQTLDDTSSEATGAMVMILGAAVAVLGVAGLLLHWGQVHTDDEWEPAG